MRVGGISPEQCPHPCTMTQLRAALLKDYDQLSYAIDHTVSLPHPIVYLSVSAEQLLSFNHMDNTATMVIFIRLFWDDPRFYFDGPALFPNMHPWHDGNYDRQHRRRGGFHSITASSVQHRSKVHSAAPPDQSLYGPFGTEAAFAADGKATSKKEEVLKGTILK